MDKPWYFLHIHFTLLLWKFLDDQVFIFIFFPRKYKKYGYYAQCESSFKKWTQAQLDVQTDI